MKSLSPSRPLFDYFQDQILSPAGQRNAVINDRTLILEAKFSRRNALMEFKVIAGKQDSTTEIKLDLEDIMFVHSMRLSVVKVKEENDNIIPLSPDLTYPDKDFFPGVLNGLKEVDAIAAVWGHGAKLSLESKLTKRLNDYDTYSLLHVPETKVAGQPSYGGDNAGRGFEPLENPFILSGKAENTIALRLAYMLSEVMEGKWDSAGADITGYNIVRLRLKGFVGLNCANAYSSWLAANQR